MKATLHPCYTRLLIVKPLSCEAPYVIEGLASVWADLAVCCTG